MAPNAPTATPSSNSFAPSVEVEEAAKKQAEEWTVNMASLGCTHLVGRQSAAEEVAQAALFLASDESSFVHGASLVVDGGWTAGHRVEFGT